MFIDTANIDALRTYTELKIFKGATTNPTLLLREGGPRADQIHHLLDLQLEKIFVQVVGNSFEDMREDYHLIMSQDVDNRIGIKVPVNFDGLKLIKYIQEEKPSCEILGTAIYSSDQGILASLAGCHYIAPYINRMENNNINPYREVEMMRHFIDQRGISTQILGASFKNTRQVMQTFEAGAHTVTLGPDILKMMVDKDLARLAIEVFNKDGYQL